MASESRLRMSESDGVTTVEFIDRNILDEANIQAIGEEIATVIERSSPPKLIISFSNVDHLSSAALGQLITINNKVRDKAGQLRLANIDPQIYEVFAITKLNKIFEIHDTTEDAVGSIG
ncbi:MAG: STAS domain-containing protein [Planctomycetota bacterium]